MTFLPEPLLRVGRLAVLAVTAALSASWAMAADAAEEGPIAGVERGIELRAHEALAAVRAETPDPQPFATDGCSGGMSHVWAFVAKIFPAFADAHQDRPPWEDCCVEHDRVYHTAGPEADPERSFDHRLEADRRLRACVAETASERFSQLSDGYGMTSAQVQAAYSAIAEAMYLAVRVGGGPCTGTPWRWGYGYPHCDRTGDRP